MSSLGTYSRRGFPALATANIAEIKAGTLYYVYRGRNAWHATWVTHYHDGCMCTSLTTARQIAERWRAQGSVFTIREQPTLILTTDAGTFAITEINTQRPLGNLASRRGAEPALKEIQQRLSSRQPPTTVEQLASLLVAAARYTWSPLCPPKSLVMVAAGPNGSEIERLRTRNLKSWASSSSGSQYYLGWSERSSAIKPSAVLRIAEWANDEVSPARPA
jgi:hypothetical protein